MKKEEQKSKTAVAIKPSFLGAIDQATKGLGGLPVVGTIFGIAVIGGIYILYQNSKKNPIPDNTAPNDDKQNDNQKDPKQFAKDAKTWKGKELRSKTINYGDGYSVDFDILSVDFYTKSVKLAFWIYSKNGAVGYEKSINYYDYSKMAIGDQKRFVLIDADYKMEIKVETGDGYMLIDFYKNRTSDTNYNLNLLNETIN